MAKSPSLHCVITGAAGGIGRSLVETFLAKGYEVIGIDICKQPPELGCCGWVQADLAQFAIRQDGADQFIESVRSFIPAEEGLQVLINNAAIQILGESAKLSRGDWHKSLGVNLLAPFFLTQGLLPLLEKAKGCVINIGSIHAKLTKPGFVAYATTKAALSGMTRAMAVDLGSRIRINAIEPAAIGTDMLQAGFAGMPEAFAQLNACHPVGRIGDVDEVSRLALILAESDLEFLQGACIALDGGIGAKLHDPL